MILTRGTGQADVKKYSHTWWGLGLISLLMVALLAMLPSRVTFLRKKYGSPSPPAVTWAEMPVNRSAGPQGSAPSSRASTVDPSAPQDPRPQAQREPGGFTLDFGTFVTAREAEDVENRLNQLGAPTTRYLKRSGSALYVLEIGEFLSPAKARETMEQLRLRHPTLPLGKVEHAGAEQITIAVDSLYPLREAVALAGQLRTQGFAVRITTAREAASLFTLRLATTYVLKTAQEKSQEFRNQGLPNAVVPVERPSSP